MVRFGVHTALLGTTPDRLVRLWQRVEDLGFGWISIPDHLAYGDGQEAPGCLEAVSAHALLAHVTRRVRVGSLVYAVGLRHPAVLANAIATIDHIAGGRATLGLGAGWLASEFTQHGIPFPPAGVRLAQLDEAVRCIRLLLTETEASFEGQHFRLDRARCQPLPVQERLPLWIGGGGERVTLPLAARHADGWNCPLLGLDDFRRKVGVLRRHLEDQDRDPASIEISTSLVLGWSQPRKGAIPLIVPATDATIDGSTDQALETVAGYRDAGADLVIVRVAEPVEHEGLERFAEEVGTAFAA